MMHGQKNIKLKVTCSMISTNNALFSADKNFLSYKQITFIKGIRNFHYLSVTILEIIMNSGHVRYESYCSTTFSHSGPRDLGARICIIILRNGHPQKKKKQWTKNKKKLKTRNNKENRRKQLTTPPPPPAQKPYY